MSWIKDLGKTVIVIYILVTIGILTSLKSLSYIIFKLKLNKLIKGMLTVMAVQNGLGFTIMLISLVFMHYSESACFPFILGFTLGISPNVVLSSCISMTRFFMTLKASQVRVPNEELIKKIIIFCMAFTYASTAINIIAIHALGMPSGMSICTGQAITFDMPPIPQILGFASSLFWMGLGLHSDVSLYRLLKSIQAQRQELET